MLLCVHLYTKGTCTCKYFSERIKNKREKKHHLGCLQGGKLSDWIDGYFSLFNTLSLLNFEP